MWFYNFPYIQTRTYFTLADIISLREGDDYHTWDYQFQNKGAYGEICAAGRHEKDTTVTITLFMEYLWPEFWNAKVLYVDGLYGDINYSDIEDEWKTKCGHIYRWLNESTERYSVLIEQLNEAKSKLMAQVKSTTTTDSDTLSLFNDTPQAGGDFDADDYVTNASKNNSSSSTTIATDAATPIARLKEVQDKLTSLYGEWANEFSRFVLH